MVQCVGWCSVLLSWLSAVEKVCEIYAAAAKAAPHSEEILTHLFMAYVRVGDYQRQQQVGELSEPHPYGHTPLAQAP